MLGCGSSSSPTSNGDAGGVGGGSSNVFKGTLGGQSVAVVDGFFYADAPSTQGDGGIMNGYQIRLAGYANACKVYLGSANKAGSSYMTLKVRTIGGAVTAGTFPVSSDNPSSGNYAEATLKVLDATCDDTKEEATSGSVIVTKLTSTEIAGTFNLATGNDTATGSFDVTDCDSSDGGATSGCVQ